jgi:uncharacterized protein YerC
MPHVSKQTLKKETAALLSDQLLTFVSIARTKQEALVLAEELFTETERLMLGKRLAIIVMLARGYSFTQIEETLAVTPQTITRLWKECKEGKHAKIQRYAREYTGHFKRTSIWSNIEKVLSAGMPPRAGKGRWKELRRSLDG